MRKKGRLETVCLLLAAAFSAAVLLLLFLTPRFDKQKVWADVKLDYAEDKTEFSLSAGDAYGVKSSGPYLDLPAGQYRLKWQIEGDGENEIRLSCSNDATIEPDTLVIPAGSFEGEGAFALRDPVHNLSIGVVFQSGERLRVRGLRLYSPGYKDRAFGFLFFCVFAFWLYAALRRGALSGGRGEALLLIAAAVLFSGGPFLMEGIPGGNDTVFHTARLMNLADALSGGQIPARVGGFSYNGWGAATPVFYPDALLYPFALLIVCGASLSFAYQSMMLCAALLTGLLTAHAGKRLFHDRSAGVCAAVLYLLCGYRLFDMYGRMALGEILAMAFLPLYFESLFSLFWGDWNRWGWAALCAAALLNCHLLTAALAALFALLCLILAFPRLLRERERAKRTAQTAAAVLLLSLGRIVPLLDFLSQAEFTGVVQFGLAEAALPVRSVLLPGGWVGAALWGGLLAAVLARRGESDPGKRNWAVALAGCGLLCVLASTRLFPWSLLMRITGGRVGILQFPWRMLSFAAACLSLCGGYGFERVFEKLGQGKTLLCLLLSVLCAAGALTGYGDKGAMIEFGAGANPYQVSPEYLLAGTDANETRSRKPAAEEGISFSDYEKAGVSVSLRVQADRDGTLSLPLFGFPGYEARLNGQPIPWARGDNNRLTVALSAGTEGVLTVKYAGRRLYTLSDLASALTFLGLCWLLFRNRKRKSSVPELE